MENRRPPSSHKGSGPRRPYSQQNRSDFGSSPRGGGERGPGGPRRPGGDPRFRSNQDGSSREGFYSRPGGKFNTRKPGFKKRDGGKPWDNKPLVKITSDLQITDGKYRGVLLQNSASPNMKPATHRLRDMLFKLVSPRKLRGSRFLDICAGAGFVGLEAISRGAMLATLVDRSARMCTWIKKNVEQLGIKTGHAEVIQTEVLPFLKQMSKRSRRWDIVFFCPPTDGTADEMFKYLGRGVAIAPGGMLIVEHPTEMQLPEPLGVLRKDREHKMDSTTLTFYDRKQP